MQEHKSERGVEVIPAFPKPYQIKKTQEAVKVYRNGREVCNCKTQAGGEEYRRRKRLMWERQDKICCLAPYCPTCPGKLELKEATFDHERGRGAGKQDDRVEVDGKRQNGVCHCSCNSWKGSRYIPYNQEVR